MSQGERTTCVDREEALEEARRELGRAKRARLLRRVMTLGLSRK